MIIRNNFTQAHNNLTSQLWYDRSTAMERYGHIGRDRFDPTASAGRRIPSASPIDLPEPIPEDPLPSSTPLRGRR